MTHTDPSPLRRRRRDRRRDRDDLYEPDRSRPHSRAGSERDYGERPPSRSHSHYSHYSHREGYPGQHGYYGGGRERRPQEAAFYGREWRVTGRWLSKYCWFYRK